VKVPKNTCSKKSPITKWKVSGYITDNKEICTNFIPEETQFSEKFIQLDMVDLNPDQQYTLQVLAKNENGWNEPSEKFTIHIPKPSTPQNVRVSSKRSHTLIKIRWGAPDSCLITHYEIVKRTKKGNYDEKPFEVPANKFSATFTNLTHNTNYYFKVCTCNGLYVSDWSQEIETNTRIHKAIKASVSPAVWAIGTVTAPIVTPIEAGTAAGMAENKAGGKTAAVAAGTAGTVGGVAYGTVEAPLVGAARVHAFVHDVDELSDQSDDEDAVIIKNHD